MTLNAAPAIYDDEVGLCTKAYKGGNRRGFSFFQPGRNYYNHMEFGGSPSNRMEPNSQGAGKGQPANDSREDKLEKDIDVEGVKTAHAENFNSI
jgi:hypothetical protein